MDHQEGPSDRLDQIDQDTEVFKFRVLVGVEQVFSVTQDVDGNFAVYNFITEEQDYTGPDDIISKSFRFKRSVGHPKVWLVHQDITGEFKVRVGVGVFAQH